MPPPHCTAKPASSEAGEGRQRGRTEVVDDVAEVLLVVVEGVRGRLGQEVHGPRHLLHQNEARQRAAAGLRHPRHAPATRAHA